ncbi:cysteine--tRNA ligase [Mycoplasma feriruminatoris]|uniref:cysteine--tRNA ligase n=1 Tax=Mycoplasma feriruminatoris TaxID=1179777 RepID=UPI00241FAC0E|nr:cysteine--tRNA ligase [Mycoplasma feriruminatoris]WFQ91348.1 cysteine--tRNA ligase [Mycoplasma feriruminatoris]
MQLYDSLSKTKKTLNKKSINLYCCGPTVYNYIHIGNARPVLLVDVLIRYLKSRNIKVNYLQNITDIDDKIILKALDNKLNELEVSQKYTKAYLEDLKSLNINKPDEIILISTKMNEMIKFIKDLVDINVAYVLDGDVYFNIKKYENEYCKLSGYKLDELISGKRVEIDSKKHYSLDFSLWKKTELGIKWDSVFGSGRPGWHTECVLLIDEYFKHQTIDIHVGGIDLKFPHHENERIQFIAKNNKELADIWLHNGHLQIENEKMSKSLGNVILVRDFIKQHNKNTLRWIFLTTNYTQPLNISNDLIYQANKFFEKLTNLSKKTIQFIIKNDLNIKQIKKSEYIDQFNNYMEDDLNTSLVLSLIDSLIKQINKNIIDKNVDDFNLLVSSLSYILDVLGFKDVFNYKFNSKTKELFLKWQQLVKEKQFDKADLIRKDLIEQGIL